MALACVANIFLPVEKGCHPVRGCRFFCGPAKRTEAIAVMGKKDRAFAALPQVSLEQLVPPNHFYRHLERTLDLASSAIWSAMPTPISAARRSIRSSSSSCS
jgi:hypothetical protein